MRSRIPSSGFENLESLRTRHAPAPRKEACNSMRAEIIPDGRQERIACALRFRRSVRARENCMTLARAAGWRAVRTWRPSGPLISTRLPPDSRHESE